MDRISPTQKLNGYSAGNRVRIKGIDVIGTLAKLIIEDQIWIVVFEKNENYNPIGYQMSTSYMESWQLDPKFLNQTHKDVYPDQIIGLAVKKRCNVCHR